MFAALTDFLYIAAGNSLIIHYSFFTIHYSFSEALCKGTTFRGTGGGALVQKGRWAALPLSPLRFSLCTLFPQTPHPLQATATGVPKNFAGEYCLRFQVSGAQCAPLQRDCEKMLILCEKTTAKVRRVE